MHSRPSRSGFTLLELLVVMTLAGVLMALALPRFASLRDGHAVRASVGDIAGSFSLARQTALAQRSAVAVVFDTAGGIIQVRSAKGPIRRSSLKESFGVTFSANRDSAVYDARGLGYGVSNLTVIVRRGNFVDTLTMSRLGRVRW
jgi:prepilin-type N-terminal cleavage/methylation domain-containing protein